MKRISQNKFASSLFSCLGVAACVAFSSCGKEDNDQFKNENEFAEFLISKAKEHNFEIDDKDLKDFAKANWKTASKKTSQFPEEIKKKQIAEEDLDNEDEELHGPEQQTPKQTNPEQQNPGTEQPNPATADSSETATITNESNLSELLYKKEGKHAGIKVNDICFDLNVFFEIYSWFEKNKGDSSQSLISSAELKLGDAIKMLEKCKKKVCAKFGESTEDQEVNVNFVNLEDCKAWGDNTVYYFSVGEIKVDVYNNLLYSLLNGKNLGFKDTSLATDGGKISGDFSNENAYIAFANLQNH